jgi:class 3 adenylate cyclase/tetratricopeptide (TPR) repeat protein
MEIGTKPEATAMDVASLLRNLDLERYEAAFRENDVDAELLLGLTDDDFKDIGVSSLGHRRRLLEAIATLRQESAPAIAPRLATRPAESIGPSETSAERRPVSVMFCDLIGSTALSSRLDPEDLREVIRTYQACVATTIRQFDGFIARYVGDGVLIYFGWPEAGETDAERAVRAGLAVAAAVSAAPVSGQPLQVRIGIATGLVVIGEPIGSGDSRQQTAVGETPNLAARLQGLAGPNQVVIDAATRRQIGGLFECQDLGTVELKGLPVAVPAWHVLGEGVLESRFEARQGRLTPFIGREQEIALVLERFERASTGEGQAVLLSGEAGIGKSRLVQVLCERLAGATYTRMRLQCWPLRTRSTLYPVLRHLEYAAGFRQDDEPDARLRKLEALFRQSSDNPAEGLAVVASLLALSKSDTRLAQDVLPQRVAMVLSPEQREARALNILIDLLLGLAARSPVLFLLEDAHWVDPATQELITQALARIAEARVLILVTHRPEFEPGWARHPHVTALTLNRLSRRQSAEIARAAAATTLPDEIVARILRRADGMPLFIEELTRSVLDLGDLSGDSIVPATLQASLLARLDRLGNDVKQIAQIAAVIGREFDVALLSAVVGKPEEALAPALSQLVTSHIVLPAGAAQGGTYVFQHALIQEAAYQSLLLSRRRQNHAEVARAIESRLADIAENQPELVAEHYTAAAEPEQAIPYWVKAGERALARSAYLEPIAHFERGLELARALPESSSRSRQILNLLLLLGETRYRNGHLEHALQTFKEAFELARTVGSSADLVRAALGAELAESYTGTRQCESAALLEEALAALGNTESAERSRLLSRLGHASLIRSGALERATAQINEATRLARRLRDPLALIYALVSELLLGAFVPLRAGQFAARRRLLEELSKITEQLGDVNLLPFFFHLSMPAYLEMGDLAAFEAQLTRFEELNAQLLGGYLMTSTKSLQAILHGDFVAAERLSEQALELAHDVQTDIATGIYGVQMFTIRREQGRLAEVAPLVQKFIAENPRAAAWRPGLALIAIDLGFEQAAHRAFEDMASGGFHFPLDAKRNITLCYLAEVCTRLGDADRGEQLYKLLLPYQDLTVVVPSATICCGAISRYLGLLSSVMGNWTAAERHFEAALDIDERLKAWPWLAHTKHEFALMLLARDRGRDRDRSEILLAEAAASAERFGMASLQSKIRAVVK